MAEQGRGMRVALWVASALMAALFVFSGGMKLSGEPKVVENFAHWGYPAWFPLLIGATELLGGILLLVPRVAFFAGGALTTVMLGAAYTHLVRATGEAAGGATTLVLAAICGGIAFARRPAVLRKEKAASPSTPPA